MRWQSHNRPKNERESPAEANSLSPMIMMMMKWMGKRSKKFWALFFVFCYFALEWSARSSAVRWCEFTPLPSHSEMLQKREEISLIMLKATRMSTVREWGELNRSFSELTGTTRARCVCQSQDYFGMINSFPLWQTKPSSRNFFPIRAAYVMCGAMMRSLHFNSPVCLDGVEWERSDETQNEMDFSPKWK